MKRFLSRIRPLPSSAACGSRIIVLALALILAPTVNAAPVITEFMASNRATLVDDDGEYSDWIEIHNSGAAPVSLQGWYLTDKATKKTKWKFPAVTLPADGYLVVFASGKDHADPAHPLHTNFKLSADGSYLGLIQPDGTTVATEFSPGFPAQYPDVAYGVTQPTGGSETPQTGYFTVATPGARNGDASTLTLIEQVAFSRPAGPFTGAPALTLTGASAGQKIRYVSAGPSATGAAVPEPTAASPEYTVPLVLNSSVIVRAAVFAADNSRHGAVTSAHYLQVDTSTANRLDTFAGRLPLVILDDHGYGPLVKDGVDHPAWFYGFLPGPGGTASFTNPPDHVSAALMTVRGSTSSLFPKKSFKFDLVNAAGQETPQGLFQLSSFVGWNLVGAWNYDRSYLRNAFAYAVSNGLGRWAPRARLAEVWFNHNGGPLDATDYAGIYLLTDKIEEAPDRINITKLSTADLDASAITGGYILRVDEPDPEKYSWTTNHGFPHPDLENSVLMVESPKVAKLAPAQRDYIRGYVQQAEDALYADQAAGWSTHNYLQYFDRDSFVDHHLLNTFLKNTDAFWRSAYMTKDRGGKLVAGPIWDFDRSQDSNDPRDDRWDSWDATKGTSQGYAMPYWDFGWWGVLAHDPDFMQAWIDRWELLRTDALSDAHLAGMLTNLAAEIGPDAGARDEARWPDNASQYGNFAGECQHLQDWILQRAQWIDQQFVAVPSCSHEGQMVRLAAPPGGRLVYTLDGSDPRLSGGGISLQAHFADTEVMFAESSLVRARTYDPEQVRAFPGSPWSRLFVPATEQNPGGGTPLPDLSKELAADLGQDLTLGIDFPVQGKVSYQWYRDGEELDGATQAKIELSHLSTSDSGTYALVISSPAGVLTKVTYQLGVSGSLHLANLSSRARVGTGADLLISGFVVDGDGLKNYLLRVVGPTLADYGVGQPLAAPMLKVFRQDGTLVGSNTGWETATDPAALVAAAQQVGAFALVPGRKDSALLLHLPRGVYSLHASGVDGGTGIGLGEIYALDEPSSPLNLSARARVKAGEDLLIGGLVITGVNPRRMLIRAVGPTLRSYGVTEALADPLLEIVSGTTTLYQNDNWDAGDGAANLAATGAAVGAFPLTAGSTDAALIVDLPPGVYNVLVRGKNNTSGIALVEIYAVK